MKVFLTPRNSSAYHTRRDCFQLRRSRRTRCFDESLAVAWGVSPCSVCTGEWLAAVRRGHKRQRGRHRNVPRAPRSAFTDPPRDAWVTFSFDRYSSLKEHVRAKGDEYGPVASEWGLAIIGAELDASMQSVWNVLRESSEPSGALGDSLLGSAGGSGGVATPGPVA